MKFTWHLGRARRQESKRKEDSDSGKPVAKRDYTSHVVVDSKVVPGVQFRIAKMSFERRLELMRKVRELARRSEFLAAGQDVGQKMDATVLEAEIQRIYVAWGISEVTGLQVDGEMAGAELLIQAGPEALFREALTAVRRETGLSEDERKNS
jgi:hypothetical protein